MSARSVRQAIDEVRQRGPLTIEVEGILNWEFENYSLGHWPKSEGRGGIGIESAGMGFRFDSDVLRRWSGKKVIILGELEGSKLGDGTIYIKARRIDLVKTRKRSEDHPDYL